MLTLSANEDEGGCGHTGTPASRSCSVDQFDAKPAEIRQLLRGGLDLARARELTDDMRAAGLPL